MYLSSSSCFCIASHMPAYWSSPCKTKQLEPCDMWHCATSIPAFFSHSSKRRTPTVKRSKAIVRGLPTEHAARATFPTLSGFSCSLYGTLWETNSSLWQRVEEEWQQWRQDCNCFQAWGIAMLIYDRCRERVFCYVGVVMLSRICTMTVVQFVWHCAWIAACFCDLIICVGDRLHHCVVSFVSFALIRLSFVCWVSGDPEILKIYMCSILCFLRCAEILSRL